MPRFMRYIPYLKGFIGALVALGLFVVGAHLWFDHLALHSLVTREMARIEKERSAP